MTKLIYKHDDYYPTYLMASPRGTWRIKQFTTGEGETKHVIEHYTSGKRDQVIIEKSRYLLMAVARIEQITKQAARLYEDIGGELVEMFTGAYEGEQAPPIRKRGSKLRETERQRIVEMYYALGDEYSSREARCRKVARDFCKITTGTVRRIVREHENQRRQAA